LRINYNDILINQGVEHDTLFIELFKQPTDNYIQTWNNEIEDSSGARIGNIRIHVLKCTCWGLL